MGEIIRHLTFVFKYNRKISQGTDETNLKNVLDFEAELYVYLEVHYSTFALYFKN